MSKKVYAVARRLANPDFYPWVATIFVLSLAVHMILGDHGVYTTINLIARELSISPRVIGAILIAGGVVNALGDNRLWLKIAGDVPYIIFAVVTFALSLVNHYPLQVAILYSGPVGIFLIHWSIEYARHYVKPI